MSSLSLKPFFTQNIGVSLYKYDLVYSMLVNMEKSGEKKGCTVASFLGLLSVSPCHH